MGIYNKFIYNDGTKYGDASKVGYSAEPLTATAVGNVVSETQVVVSKHDDGTPVYGSIEVSSPAVDLTWTNPTGSVFGFRIVRNQDGWSETEEDGVIIVETFNPVIPTVTAFTDQNSSVPLKQGKYVYYTVWLMLADYSWVIGAQTYCLIPKEHNSLNPDGSIFKDSTRKFIELFPKVYTTSAQSYLDEVDTTSDFYTFFSGFAYTLDEIQTYADLLVPDISGKSTNPNTVSLQAQQLGIPVENTLSIQRQKDLIRNYLTINKYRGTVSGARQFAQSATGYSTDATMSPNLLLSPQDSTFYKTTGNWVAGTNGTLTANLTTGAGDLPYQSESYSIDRSYTGKFITTSTNVYMALGENDPKLKGIPVIEGVVYQLSYYVKDSGINVTPSITWYDITGASLSTTTGTAAAAGSTWSKVTLQGTAPTGAQFASIRLTYASAGTFYVDMIQFASTKDPRVNVFYEARGIELHFNPTKVNYVLNPSFNGTTNWTVTGLTSTSNPSSTLPGVTSGANNMLVGTAPSSTSWSIATSTRPAIASGKYYTLSAYVATTSGTETISLTLAAYGNDGSLLVSDSGSNATNTASGLSVTSSWTRYSVSLFVPGVANKVSLTGTISGTGAGNQLNFDAVQIEQGYGSTDYFDGTYGSRGAYWLGAANNSAAILYRNKSNAIGAVTRHVQEVLPLNTPYILTSGNNDTFFLASQTPTISSGTVTLATYQIHSFYVGQTVVISGLSPAGYNGTYTITAIPSSTSFSYTNATTGNITVGGFVSSLVNLETSGFSS